jgi:hypothetical protein
MTNTLSANEPDNQPKNIFRSKCENSTKEISLLDGFQDKSFIIEISDFGGGYISFKMTLYNNSDCKSSWLNKLEYFEMFEEQSWFYGVGRAQENHSAF